MKDAGHIRWLQRLVPHLSTPAVWMMAKYIDRRSPSVCRVVPHDTFHEVIDGATSKSYVVEDTYECLHCTFRAQTGLLCCHQLAVMDDKGTDG